MGSVIFGTIGVLCLLYCAAIAFSGFGTRFFLIWGVLGAGAVLLSALLARRELIEALPGWLKGAAVGVFCLGMLVFCTVEGFILSRAGAKAQPGAEYCIILGAQWKTGGPSEVLRRRLDKAVEYLRANPETLAVVSGGQGANEPIAEADGMRGYLMEAGIAEERILTESRSGNTRENLAFSAELIDRENGRTVIVTNGFHMFRALGIARKQGYRAEGLAADSVAWMLPNNLLREFFGVLKDLAVGNM
ncbi:MAG: YdcF family protein [Roseburia sp.]|nr:YdcF family protein [Roseburia sp.]MCM1098023.1 YdcF family protein [Ruminococcus flavefaciens]